VCGGKATMHDEERECFNKLLCSTMPIVIAPSRSCVYAFKCLFANGRFTRHSKKYIERVGIIRIFKHVAVEDLTKTFAMVYNSQADLIWPDIPFWGGYRQI
jgi:hypothetical protein